MQSFNSMLPSIGIAGALAAIAMFWGNIKSVFQYFYNIFVVEITISHTVQEALYDYLYKNKMVSRSFRSRDVQTNWLFYKPANRSVDLPVENAGKFLLFFNHFFPIFIKDFSQPNQNIRYKITFLRFTLDFDKLIKDAFMNHISLITNDEDRVFIQRFTGSSIVSSKEEDAIGPTVKSVDYGFSLVGFDKVDTINNSKYNFVSNYCFSKESLDALEFIKKWKSSKTWYKNKGIPWTIGLCLEGKPGTGKTSFCKVVASELNIPIFVFDIATMSNDEFVKFWRRSQTSSPCLNLIEDIDRVFDKDKNITTGDVNKQHLTFDCLLNCISGVENSNGIVTVITANNGDRIDESLGKIDETGKNSRPGRIDFILHFDILDEECRQQIAKRMFVDSPELIENIVRDGEGMTGAQFINKCSTLALNSFWDKKDKI